MRREQIKVVEFDHFSCQRNIWCNKDVFINVSNSIRLYSKL